MSIGLKRGTVAVEPHRIEWDIAAQEIINKLKDILKDGILYRRQDHPGQHLYACFDADNDIQTHFIHVVIYGEKQWNDYLNMRDYLNANKDKAKEYSDLKERLAKMFPEDRQAYTNGKSELIETILQSAEEWRKHQSGLVVEL